MANNTTEIIIEKIQAALGADGQTNIVVTSEAGFFELGLSSIRLAELTDELNEIFPEAIEVTDFFDLQNVQALSDKIEQQLQGKTAA